MKNPRNLLGAWVAITLVATLATAFFATAGSAAATSCSNELFRIGPSADLPDCRAYEQATPVGKDGASAEGASQYVQAAPDGGAIAFIDQSDLPGAEGAQDFGTYLSTRGEAQWSTQGLLPPARAGVEGRVVGKSPDLHYTYVESDVPVDEGFLPTFYQRDNLNGQLTLIAQVAPNYAGTSSDDSKVLFEAEKRLASGAVQASNLYVWDRNTGHIVLAGALNPASGEGGGEAPPQGAVTGPYAWSGQNQVTAGGIASGYYTDNAFSTDGESLFFTALGSGQIYLRRHLEAPQSPLDGPGGRCSESQDACTVEVSAAQAEVPDPEGEKPAAFVFASSEGSPTAFFLSSGKLTDNATTGSADQGNDLYRYDAAAGRLEDLTPDRVDPNGAEVRGVLGGAADGSRLYFVANGVLGEAARAGAKHGNCALTANSKFLESGECNLYLWEAGAGITFVTRVDAESDIATSDSVDWTPNIGVGGPQPKTSRVSDDGRVLLFRSQRQLTNYQNAGVPQFYRYGASEHEITCISCDPSGASPVAQPSLSSVEIFAGLEEQGAYFLTRNLSSNGDRVFFESPDRLVPDDQNSNGDCPPAPEGKGEPVPSCQDVYEWEAEGTGSCQERNQANGCIHLISSGSGDEPSFFADADPEGENVFFYTGQQLVSQDKDQAVDIYDARVNGGLSAQFPNPGTHCLDANTCRSLASTPPAALAPSSTTLNEPPKPSAVKCRRRYKRRKRGKPVCVRRHRRGSGHLKQHRHNSNPHKHGPTHHKNRPGGSK